MNTTTKILIRITLLLTVSLPFGKGWGWASFAQPTWVTSGAAIGNVSTYTYPASWAGTTLTLINPSSQDELKVSDVTGSPNGVHIYGVNVAPSIVTGITGLGSNDRYFGVFVANGTTPTYTVTYNYTGNPYVGADENNLLLFKRNNNSSTPWTDASASLDATANTLTKTSESSRGEYILGLSSGFLPIELLYFSAKWKDDNHNTAVCEWETATEINNDYFVVERSKDAHSFIPVLKVYSEAGNSTTKQHYLSYDYIPYTDGISYYRLKQVDRDGKFSYSQIEALSINKTINLISIYPNPATNFFEYLVGSTDDTNVKVKAIDVLGRTVIEKTNTLSKGVSKIKMDVSFLSPGTYLLQIIMDNKEKTEKQFLIQ